MDPNSGARNGAAGRLEGGADSIPDAHPFFAFH